MPKRVLDGEAVWSSDKLAAVEPKWMRAEFANLVPLALANGVFEVSSRKVWSKVYGYNRPEISVGDVDAILKEFERVGLLFRWTEGNKEWGYWIGIEKPGRLPPASRTERRPETLGPDPPKEKLEKYRREGGGYPAGSHRVASGYPGSGSGSGSGLGAGASFAGRKLRLTKTDDDMLADTFPQFSAKERAEKYREMDAWLCVNPKRMPKKHCRFAYEWLKREKRDNPASPAKKIPVAKPDC